ncbi:hypothetical protein D6C78_09526 [Aureobasidium pullulans]|uniref:Uncharacterized protein n=1 Tax=Aureobasidium pullulans TaxID=5580 RepID=A0A4T0BH45_AURPU|nr:hypothetical protein D6C78_09526 [Aureobasidium pullulans]
MTRNGTGPASAFRKLSGDGDVGIYQTPARCKRTMGSGTNAAYASMSSTRWRDVQSCEGPGSSGVWRGDESTHGRTKVETFKHTSGSFTPATSNASSPLSRSFLYDYLRADNYPRSVSSLSSGSKTSLQLPRA